MAGEGFIDPLGQVAQILGVSRASGNGQQSPSERAARKAEGVGPAAAVHLSHSGSALARLADRLRAVGFVQDPGKVFDESQHEGVEQSSSGESPPGQEEMAVTSEKTDPDGKNAKKRHHGGKKPGEHELTKAEQEEVRELKEKDREVRAHEMAHKAAAGELAPSGPHYEYQTGPDGHDYAVGGHVPIKIPASDDPKETLAKAEKARQAALAPADPSPADRAVAQEASHMASQARAQISAEAKDEANERTEEAVKASEGSDAEKPAEAKPEEDDENAEDRAIEAKEHPEFLLGRSFGLRLDPTNRS